MRPAGSSAPLLMRKPVDNRCSVLARAPCDLARLRWAIIDETFVLIRDMPILRDCLAAPIPGAGNRPATQTTLRRSGACEAACLGAPLVADAPLRRDIAAVTSCLPWAADS